MEQTQIRNFAIIAHIDHGKSTLADRLLELTHTIAKRDMQEQLLDSNPIERERGITIKLAPVRMEMNYDSQHYILNLIDTPGHVDFSYEVSRSLAACEGAVLVVDATQGVQAQTLAHLHQARLHHLVIIPVINKIDLPNARIKETINELNELGFEDEEMIQISAKTGVNINKVLEAIIGRIPPPSGNPNSELRALIFSSQYDSHKGVVVFVRIMDGEVSFHPNLKLKFLATSSVVAPIEIGYFKPSWQPQNRLVTGEVGYIATGLKDVKLAKVGDTICLPEAEIEPLPGYKEPKPMVYLSLFPLAADDYQDSREAMERLRLSDSAFTFRPISSLALGNGFHCGFLGLLHAEIVQERIQREFGLSMIATSPSVEYQLKLNSGINPSRAGLVTSRRVAGSDFFTITSASEYPDPSFVNEVREPIMNVKIFSPKRYVGAVMQLATEKRGEYVDLVYQADNAEFTYLMPLADMIIDFFDRLKSVTEGYASLDYEFFEFNPVAVARVDILVNHEKVDALSFLVIEKQAHDRAKEIVEKLATVISRHQFSIPIQGVIGGTVIARSDVKAFRKDVIQKLYGGDRTRKDKLLEAQKKGKERMKMIGKVNIPQTAFFQVLKRD